LRTYAIATLAHHCYRAGIRHSILQAIDRSRNVADQIDKRVPLPLTYNVDNDELIIPLNAAISSRVLEVLRRKPEDMLETFCELATAIGPHVTRKAIMRKSPEAKIAVRLFDADRVVRPFLGDRAEEFYIKVRAIWEWNSRYWEQRALLIAESDLVTALQYGRHAVAVEAHPFTHTTLAKLLFMEMQRAGSNPERVYSEAYSLLQQAIRTEATHHRISVPPFFTLFRGTASYLELGGRLERRLRLRLEELIAETKVRFAKDRDVLKATEKLEPLLDAARPA
jgi:hypothetical protein